MSLAPSFDFEEQLETAIQADATECIFTYSQPKDLNAAIIEATRTSTDDGTTRLFIVRASSILNQTRLNINEHALAKFKSGQYRLVIINDLGELDKEALDRLLRKFNRKNIFNINQLMMFTSAINDKAATQLKIYVRKNGSSMHYTWTPDVPRHNIAFVAYYICQYAMNGVDLFSPASTAMPQQPKAQPSDATSSIMEEVD